MMRADVGSGGNVGASWALLLSGSAGGAGRRGGKEGRAMRYCFGDYVLDTQRAELQHAGVPIKLQPKVLQVLAYLVAHHERVVPIERVHRCAS